MSEEPNWELKDRRIAWMNSNSSCANIIAARIQAGLFKPKDNKEAMKELLDAIMIETTAFLGIRTGDVPHGGEEKPPVKKELECASCGVEVNSQKVRTFSLEHYGKVLCYDCQNKPEGDKKTEA